MKKVIFFSLLIIQSLCAQIRFTFAHISDTHVGGSTGAEDLQRTVEDINDNGDIQFALITGDITEFGSDEQLRSARTILSALSVPWYIIPEIMI